MLSRAVPRRLVPFGAAGAAPAYAVLPTSAHVVTVLPPVDPGRQTSRIREVWSVRTLTT